jgi:hypothetical protein
MSKHRIWTEEEREWVRQTYPRLPTADIAARFGVAVERIYQLAARLGLKKSAQYLASPAACRLRRGDQVGAAFRFKPGQVPFNKGLRQPGWGPGRMKETQFKKGCRVGAANNNWQPVGSIRADADGYLRIKLREALPTDKNKGFGNPDVWPLLHRHVWEQSNGPIPAGHAVVFRDRDRSNCDLGNLELITRQALMLRNSSQRWGPDVFKAIQLRGALNRKIRSQHEKQDVGPTQPSL